jgi:uncharacterized RmlC-like cupin family protein
MLLVVAVGTQPLLAGESRKDGEIIVIRPDASVGSKQGLPVFEGISGQNAGAQGISMNRVIIPPGGAARAHLHKGYESVIYLVKGRVKTLYGEGLKRSVINKGGDFIYIPAGVPHKPINLSDTLAAPIPTSKKAFSTSPSRSTSRRGLGLSVGFSLCGGMIETTYLINIDGGLGPMGI